MYVLLWLVMDLGSEIGLLLHTEKWQKIWQKMKKSLVQLAFNPLLKTQNQTFEKPVHHLLWWGPPQKNIIINHIHSIVKCM